MEIAISYQHVMYPFVFGYETFYAYAVFTRI
jgi:hypothetical protein